LSGSGRSDLSLRHPLRAHVGLRQARFAAWDADMLTSRLTDFDKWCVHYNT